MDGLTPAATPLDAAIATIAAQVGVDAAALIAYAAEDTIGGYPDRWPTGSLWAVEGQVLYALTRALRPQWVVELGVHVGCSTTHLRSAVQRNGTGRVTSVDQWSGAGRDIPAPLARFGALVFEEATAWLRTVPDQSIDLLFEDCIHSESEVRDIWQLARQKCKPGALIVSHDSEHGDDGVQVRAGVKAAGFDNPLSLLIRPSDCGLIMARCER